jgi:surfeit locus 1 family protein
LTSSEAQGAGAMARKLIVPGIAALAGLIVLLSLGFWQLDRLAWKEALIAKVERDISEPAVPAPGPSEWPDMAPDEADYRHVSLAGEFLPGSAYYYTSLGQANGPVNGPGYLVYAPFRTSDGWVVMVNRGFIPQGLDANGKAKASTSPAGLQELAGLVRKSEEPNWTTPGADAENRIWFARDTDHMLSVLGFGPEQAAPYSVDLDGTSTPSSGLPQAGETVVRFKNDHLGYALTWFGLAATLVGVFAAYAISIVRTGSKKNGSA